MTNTAAQTDPATTAATSDDSAVVAVKSIATVATVVNDPVVAIDIDIDVDADTDVVAVIVAESIVDVVGDASVGRLQSVISHEQFTRQFTKQAVSSNSQSDVAVQLAASPDKRVLVNCKISKGVVRLSSSNGTRPVKLLLYPK